MKAEQNGASSARIGNASAYLEKSLFSRAAALP
jgi:hypothetical protein